MASFGGAEKKSKLISTISKELPPLRTALVSKAPSEALDSLRKQTNAAEAEGYLRHEPKNSVDAKLAAWKTGSEYNIRALIAGLDTVLSLDLGTSPNTSNGFSLHTTIRLSKSGKCFPIFPTILPYLSSQAPAGLLIALTSPSLRCTSAPYSKLITGLKKQVVLI